MASEQPEFRLYTDGGARGNPGPAAIGIVLVGTDGNILRKHGEYIGESTNNRAEYRALLKGLDIAAVYWKGTLRCVSDSELLVKQMNGVYKVKDMKGLFFEVKKSEKRFTFVDYTHVNRTDRFIRVADALVNAALDAREKKPR